MDKDMIEEQKELADMTAEDVLEFVYEISDKWEKEKDPIESIKSNLRTMIRAFKEDKFEKMQNHFGVL